MIRTIKFIVALMALLVVVESCSSAKTKRGCDGHRKTRVQFGYM